MIKRSGVELMNARSKNASIAKETITIMAQKSYTSLSGKTVDITESLDAAVNGTMLYQNQLEIDNLCKIMSPVLEVSHETTAQAAVRLSKEGKTNLVALNFASARNQGGGFLAGAIAQEEDLCRCSGLYACLKRKPVFYNENILCDNSIYTDNALYSPKVPFFRDDHKLFLEEPFLLSIISCPAPNISSMKNVDEKLLEKTLKNRAIKILQVAAHHGHENLILGAWGCGAFGNNPDMVAEAFLEGLKVIPAFDYVCFAVFDSSPDLAVLDAFKKAVNG